MVRTRCPAVTVLALSGWLITGCQMAGRPVPTPIPVPPERLPEAREQVLELARKQVYDINPGASARAELDEGAQVTLEPQDGTYRLSEAQLATGRVVGRFINNSDKPVRRYGLAPRGTSYWVVYRGARGEWLSAVISDGRSRELDRYGLRTTMHIPTRPWRQSIAQWQLAGVLMDRAPGGGMLRELAVGRVAPWVNCRAAGCCAFDPDDPPPQ